MNDRAAAVAIGEAVAGIIGMAILYLLVQEFFDPLKTEYDRQVTNATAQQTGDWIGIGFDNFLVIFLGVTALGTIAFAAYQRQGGL